jgi:hypothetical protein
MGKRSAVIEEPPETTRAEDIADAVITSMRYRSSLLREATVELRGLIDLTNLERRHGDGAAGS